MDSGTGRKQTNLRLTATKSFVWQAIERSSVQVIRFVIGMVLARLLGPDSFGVIALAMVGLGIAQVVVEGGMGAAIVQGKTNEQAVLSSIFYYNVGFGVLCAGILWVISASIASFFDAPILGEIFPIISLNLIIGSFGIVPQAIMTKKLQFKELAKVGAISTLVSGCVGVGMALGGFGIWSLVVHSMTNQVIRVCLLWRSCSWVPILRFSWSSLRRVLPFGSRLLVANFTEVVFNNLYIVVVGKIFPPSVLGFYSRADQLLSVIMVNLSATVSGVAFPIFSTIQDDTNRLKNALSEGVAALAFVSFPAAFGIAVVAEPLILVLLGEQWRPAIPFVQLLSCVWFTYPLHAINLSVLLAQGESHRYLKLQLTKKAVAIAALSATWPYGVYSMIGGQIVTGLICYYMNSYYTKKLLGYSFYRQILDVLPYFICSLLMVGVVHSVTYVGISSNSLLLIAQITLGIVSYGGLCHLYKLEAFKKALTMVLEIRKTR